MCKVLLKNQEIIEVHIWNLEVILKHLNPNN